MKKFLLPIIILFLVSCSPPEGEIEITIDHNSITGLILDAYEARLANSTMVHSVLGSMTAVFVFSEDQSGLLSINYNNFSVPDLCSFEEPCVCNGFLLLSLTPDTIVETQNPSAGHTRPYNPLDPDMSEGQVGGDNNDIFEAFYYASPILEETNESQCDTLLPRSIRIRIYADKRVVFGQHDRDIFLKPRKY